MRAFTYITALILSVFSASVYADVGVPPSPPPVYGDILNPSVPSGSAVINTGLHMDANGKPVVPASGISSGGGKTPFNPAGGGASAGHNTINVNATDKYGASASGKVNTTTKVGWDSASKAFGGLWGAQIAGAAANGAAAGGIGQQLANGDFSGAAATATQAIGNAVSGGLGDGINNIFDQYYKQKVQNEQRKYDEGQQKVNDAKQRGYRGYYVVGYLYIGWTTGYVNKLAPAPGGIADKNYSSGWMNPDFYKSPPGLPDVSLPIKNGCNSDGTVCEHNYLVDVQIHPASEKQLNDLIDTLRPPAPTAKDFIPTQAEAQKALEDALKDNTSALNQNTQALSALMNGLISNGYLNSGNTVSTIDAPVSFTTAPYTPIGSSSGGGGGAAQQTQFTVNKDGTVTANTIMRPDLAPNSAQAPGRVPVSSSASNSSHGNNNKPSSPDETKPDACAINPNALGCLPAGSAGYEDIKLPTHDIAVNLNPVNIFSSDGTCPAPAVFTVNGAQQTFEYDFICDAARKLRPWVVLLSMVIAFTTVYMVLGSGKR